MGNGEEGGCTGGVALGAECRSGGGDGEECADAEETSHGFHAE